MKQLSFICLFIGLISPAITKAQGIKKETKDPDVALMEANRKTDAPFIVQFNPGASYGESDAQNLFTKYLSLRPGTDELRFKLRDQDQDNIAVTRYQQYFKGIKVEHGSYMLTSKNEKAAFITGDFYTVPENINIQPSLSESEALAKALQYKNAQSYKWEIPVEEADIKNTTGNPAATYYPKGELVLVENFMADSALKGKVFLAWKFDVYAQKPVSRTMMYIDAMTGKILMTDEIIKHAHNDRNKTTIPDRLKKANNGRNSLLSPLVTGTADTRYSGTVSIPTQFVSGSYRLQAAVATEGYPLHTMNLNKTTTTAGATEFTDVNNLWTAAEFDNANFDNAALDAHWGAAKVYDYWKTRHGRNSYNNANAVINSYVHLDVDYNNAYWNGTAMFYGDGTRVAGGFLPLTALDVCGHEIGHAVCTYTCNLAYNRESGAMNEGLSDIWGASIEHYSDPLESDVTAKSYFDIGEEIGLPLPTPLRSMSNPNLYSQPETYLGTSWYPATVAACPTPNSSTNDNCGVHYNSGVLNKWFYLMVTGGSGSTHETTPHTYVVGALGWLKAEKVVYLTEQNMTSTSDYNAARTISIAAATTLYGPACSLDVENVTRAWYAVSVGSAYVACTPQVGFKVLTSADAETSGSTACPSSHVLTIPMQIVGGVAPAGGNATVTVTASGTATSGQDYTLGTATATFNAASTTDQNITLNIIQDGAVEGPETIVLDFTVTANGSNLAKSGAYQQQIITITDDDTAPADGNTTSSTSYTNTYTTTLNTATPFRSNQSGRVQYLYTAAELTAAGLVANRAIKNVYFYVVTKNSTTAFANFNVSMGNTAVTTTSPYVTGLSPAYSGSLTTVPGDNNITLGTPFTWTGGNLVVEVCYTNAAAGSADPVAGYSTTNTTGLSNGTTTGCALAIGATSGFKPQIGFIQQIAPSAIESVAASTRAYQVSAGQSTYFYSTADNELIAGVTNPTNDLGCVTATVTVAGSTWPALTGYPTTKRSAKEFSITPTINGATTSYKGTLYYTNAELAAVTPSSLILCKTNAATDAGINSGNTVLVATTMTTGTTYRAFTGNFTGFSRFFLVDNAFIGVVALEDIKASAFLTNGFATVQWKTTQENNSDHFVIERSYDGNNFKELKQMPSAGNSASERQYSIVDADAVQKTTYYRVKLFNISGTYVISNIVSVKNTGTAEIAIIPNPVKDQFMIRYNYAGKSAINIIDATGRKISSFIPAGTSGTMNVNASAYKPGVYLVMFTTDDNKVITEKFVKE